MKAFLIAITLIIGSIAQAKEIISIQSPYSPSHSGTPAMYKIIDEANRLQDRYQFVLEFRPGGEQLLAVKALDERPQNRLAIIAPKFVEHNDSGKLSINDYFPVHALGDACWAVITNVGDAQRGVDSLRGLKELTVGGVGIGNATHLTSLQLAEKHGFSVRYIPFRSNFDALILMVSDGSINLVIDRISSYQQYREKNPNVKILAMSCPGRHPTMPEIRTLKEQGIVAPFIFNITVAHKLMDQNKRTDISRVLQDATVRVGKSEIQKLSDMNPPVFDNISLDSYYKNSIALVASLLKKHQRELQQ